MRTSLFSEFDARLCEEVLGKTVYQEEVDWDKLLGSIIQDNLFVLTYGEQGTCFRYIQFFREFLQYCLERDLPDEKRSIMVRQAEVDLIQGKYEEAYQYLSALGDLQAMVKFISQAGQHMLQEGRFMTLIHWLDQIPETIIDSNPSLLTIKAMAILPGKDVEKAISLLN